VADVNAPVKISAEGSVKQKMEVPLPSSKIRLEDVESDDEMAPDE